MNDEANAWWSQLRHQGVLISPIVMRDWLPNGPAPVNPWRADKLRASYQKFRRDPALVRSFLDDLFEGFLGHEYGGAWKKEQHVPDRFKRKGRRPHRVLTNAGNENAPRFVMMIDDERVAREDGTPHRLGLHSGRKVYADLLRVMRDADVPLGVLTNGHHVRLIYAGIDHESWSEWDVATWFEGGDLRATMDGFYTLLGSETLPNDSANTSLLLLDKVHESRDRQADLSHVMGTQIRESVEILLEEVADSLRGEGGTKILAPLEARNLTREQELGALYQGTIRYVMRLVVSLYAESRHLLPKDDGNYYDSYSVEGLYQLLHQSATDGQEETMKEMRSAWPRLLALFRAVHDGSGHIELPIPAYGGQLFKPANAEAKDSVLIALAAIEHPDVRISDWAIYRVLRNLRVGKFKVGRGKWQPGPVDFSDLRTEYIGMMYEGLLDYDLRAAREEDGGIVFLRLGDEPALPLNVLDREQTDADLKKLLAESKKGGTTGGPDAAEAGEDDEETETTENDGDETSDEENEDTDQTDQTGEETLDGEEAFEQRVHKWACRAVEVGALFGCTPAKLKKLDKPKRDETISAAARKLILRAYPPGSMYLVRWSGTRKGSGTFYTKPALAVPTTQRTIGPIVYDHYDEPDKRVPKTPDQILSIKVCDPAMGSGSFLVAAVRTITDALKESFETHILPTLKEGERRTTTGHKAVGLLTDRILEYRAKDGDDERLMSAYKRAVVEHCIYGVDLNPLAVELGKLSLWIETMDPKLSFTFLDHKVKCGNSLIGAWQIQAENYPLGAWHREMGDGATNPRTRRLKRLRKDVIVPEMKQFLDDYELQHGAKRRRTQRGFKVADTQRTLGGTAAASVQARFTKTEPSIERRIKLTDARWNSTPDEVAVYERDVYDKLHASNDPAEQESDYRKLILENEGHKRQKFLLDMWCAAWFWPIHSSETAPLDVEPILTPRGYHGERKKPDVLDDNVRDTIERVAEANRFFHWELEYPDVFNTETGRFGFDATVGNPPWDTAKPQDNEFFTKYAPAYRTYGKQQGLRWQKELFAANPSIQNEFWNYQEGYKSQSNFVRNTHALDEPKLGSASTNEKWTALTRDARRLSAASSTPYSHQGGGDLNLYKLFTERALAQTQLGGRIGLILPSGIYSDYGTRDLRNEFYHRNSWEWIFSFENRRLIFSIDNRFKFACIVLGRGARTERVRVRSYEHDTSAWGAVRPPHVSMTIEDISRFSPENLAPMEIKESRDQEIVEKILSGGKLLGDGFEYLREFDMTNDSDKFHPVKSMEIEGFEPRPDGTWLGPGATIARPVVEGKMFGQQTAVNPQPRSLNGRPQGSPVFARYLVTEDVWRPSSESRFVMRDIINPTNKRTFFGAVIPPFPCGNKAPVIRIHGANDEEAAAYFCSYAFDFYIRNKFSTSGGGGSLNPAYLREMPFVHATGKDVADASAILNQLPPIVPRLLDPLDYAMGREQTDEVVADACHLTHDDMRWILRPNNADPRNLWRDYRDRLKVLEAAGKKGRWYTLAEGREIRARAGMKVDF